MTSARGTQALEELKRHSATREVTHPSFFSLHSTVPGLWYKRINHIASRIVQQLVIGCQQSACKNTTCYTGRSNTSSSPVRAYTVRSARIIALSLLLHRDASEILCGHDVAVHMPSTIGQDDGPADASSLVQQMSETAVLKSISTAVAADIEPDFGQESSSTTAYLYGVTRALLRTTRETPYHHDGSPNRAFVKDMFASQDVLVVISCLLAFASPVTTREIWYDSCVTANRTEEGLKHLNGCDGDSRIARLEWDEYSFLAGTVEELCHSFGYRWTLCTTMTKLGMDRTYSFHKTFRERLTQLKGQVTGVQNHYEVVVLMRLITRILLKTTSGLHTVKRGTTAHGALQLLHLLAEVLLPEPSTFIALHDMFAPSDFPALAESWLKHDHNSNDTQHLLSFWSLFSGELLAGVFSAISCIRMRATRISRHVAEMWVRQSIQGFSESIQMRTLHSMEQLQQNFLLLRVRRSHLLEDSLDQLWQRSAHEIQKPLRIRLIEMDDTAMGQDVGGVQLEFFNLVVSSIMQEESGFFTTNETGFAYFRPGSLQPLHMFEYIGVLFGLALYNGIAIPVNFPHIFYCLLTSGPFFSLSDTLTEIADRWPSEASSISSMRVNDVTSMGLAYEFNLQANGTHLTITRSSLRSLVNRNERTEPVTLNISGVHDQSGQATLSSVDSLRWPGWQLVPEADAEEHLVTQSNKAAYAWHYVHWLIYLSVKPQFDAFQKGFETVVGSTSLRLLQPPQLIRVMLEGSSTINIQMLRNTTSYEGFDGDGDPYVGMFWSVVEGWSVEKQKALVRFVTALERVPSLSVLRWKIACNPSPLPDLLPTSSTCFSTLYLPLYPSRQVLEEKLTKALELGEYGFGVG